MMVCYTWKCVHVTQLCAVRLVYMELALCPTPAAAMRDIRVTLAMHVSGCTHTHTQQPISLLVHLSQNIYKYLCMNNWTHAFMCTLYSISPPQIFATTRVPGIDNFAKNIKINTFHTYQCCLSA